MPILSTVGKKSWSHRAAVWVIYITLSVLGISMVIPFMIALSSSVSNDIDYQRYRPVPRYLYSKEERFVKGLMGYFNNYRGWHRQLQAYFPDVPSSWSIWLEIGEDSKEVDEFANLYLKATPEQVASWKVMAADYSDFAQDYPVADSFAVVNVSRLASDVGGAFVEEWINRDPQKRSKLPLKEKVNGGLDLIYEKWGIRLADFSMISFNSELLAPLWQQGWYPPDTPKYETFLDLKRKYRAHVYTPGVQDSWIKFLRKNGRAFQELSEVWPVQKSSPEELKKRWAQFCREDAPAFMAVPQAMRAAWWDYLQSEEVALKIGLKGGRLLDIETYNRMAGTHYTTFRQTPFPIPTKQGGMLGDVWKQFLSTRYPLRLNEVLVTPELSRRYQDFLKMRLKTIENANMILGTSYSKWEDIQLRANLPNGSEYKQHSLWGDFVRELPLESRTFYSSESSFQKFILARYGSLEKLNTEWKTSYACIEEVFPPLDKAYYVTFINHEWSMALSSAVINYKTVIQSLMLHDRVIPVTFVLIAGSILISLTINPVAAYALSRFNMRGQDKIILFLLATSAFPAMVSAIPGYLLMRDIGWLNTFYALLLPSAVNGMSIFILKGFFDSLPTELYEAATIDGAREWQIFLFVTTPLVKPILAVNALNAFIQAYNGWEWAIIICQDKSMWTMTVWMYQMSNVWRFTPWITMAGFVLCSIPTLIVFLACQKVILKGMIIPQMK